MPAISKIRLTNIIYEEGNKRYNDEIFLFDGHNGAILLENGGGKTVFIQTALQAILPHTDLADRKIKNTLLLENAPAHIAIEWKINEKPRRYVVTCISLFMSKNSLDSLRYVYEYEAHDHNRIEEIPFVREYAGQKRPADRGEMQDYYSGMRDKSFRARTFGTLKEYRSYLEETYHLIAGEWESIAKINSTEGGVEAFFEECKNTGQLFDRLLVPAVEQSISGHNAQQFADIFEKQRESFKVYKELKESIAENEKIQEQLKNYVSSFEVLNEKQLSYLKVKQRAKGLWSLIREQKLQVKAALDALSADMKKWQEDELAADIKRKSYEILVEKTKFEELDRTFSEHYGILQENERQLSEGSTKYASMKLARFKRDLKNHVDRLENVERRLREFEQSEELTDYHEKLEELKQALHGYYQKTLDYFEKKKRELQYEINPLLTEIAKLEREENKLGAEEKEAAGKLAKIEERIFIRQKDMDILLQKLLSNPEQENVKDAEKKWLERRHFLEAEWVRLQQELKLFVVEIREAGEETENLAQQLKMLEMNKNRLDDQAESLSKAEQQLLMKLGRIRPQWANEESVYLKQERLESRLGSEIEKLELDRERLLQKERLAYRYVDDYAQQQTFFADPFLSGKIATWKNQFDLLLTGAEFLQQMDSIDREKRQHEWLWPLSLITTAKSKQSLIEKMRGVADQLEYPIVVLSTEEAAFELNGGMESWVAPLHWDGHLNEDEFADWKQRITSIAAEAKTDRVAKEHELASWKDAAREFFDFLERYPYDFFQNLQSERSSLSKQIEETGFLLKSSKERKLQLDGKRKRTEVQLKECQDEKNGLESKLIDANQYFGFEKEVAGLKREEEAEHTVIEQFSRRMQGILGSLRDLRQEHADKENERREADFEIRKIHAEPEYKAVTSLRPIFTDRSLPLIRDEITEAEMAIRKITTSRGEWLARKEAELKGIQDIESSMDTLKKEHHAPLDEDLVYPENGDVVLSRLLELKKQLENALPRVRNENSRLKTEADVQRGQWQTKVKLLAEAGHEPVKFEFSLTEISDLLDAEQKTLAERKAFLNQQFSMNERQWKETDEAEREMERVIEAHHFDAPDIDSEEMSSADIMNFSYKRLGFAEGMTFELRGSKEEMDKEHQSVESARKRFREFCGNEISNVKMRRMALSGVESKESFAEIVAFRNNMLRTVETAIQYANEHIRKNDQELQAFINLVYSHLETVAEELRQIPKKTRVKVEDDWKQIFSFSIPEWKEEEAKTRIQDHIEWIIEQLGSDRFLNEQGMEDAGKVRKEIEGWLQTKQLLQIVLNNEVMKVSCRKVTNDNKVTTRSYSWEQSNVWSGGEKWSKNMTLFLGLLNYVAEKKQHIMPNMKRHRSVILDNPFGKASSDHVLNPVFFVAEQLGFQIIALTAHAEGKFLQDYFPVIYSCRLRSSEDKTKQIMTKEKWLHHAYFQDHEPVAMERLGESEQMTFF